MTDTCERLRPWTWPIVILSGLLVALRFGFNFGIGNHNTYLLHALRHLKVPAILVAILAFMYRYLFVLVDEAGRLMRARAARSAQLPGQPGGRSLAWRATVAGSMVGQLFGRSVARSDRVYQAMLARGYQGELLTMNPHHMRRQDWRALALSFVLIAALQLVGRLL